MDAITINLNVEILNQPESLSGETVLPNFELDLRLIFPQ